MNMLDEAHYDMFGHIRKFHEESADVANSVSAITSVVIQRDNTIKKTLLLIKGVWNGSGTADVRECKGWKTSVVPLHSTLLAGWFANAPSHEARKIGHTTVELLRTPTSTSVVKVQVDGMDITVQQADERHGGIEKSSQKVLEVELRPRAWKSRAAIFTHISDSEVSGYHFSFMQKMNNQYYNLL